MLTDAVAMLQARYPGRAIANYLVLDCETTGFELQRDLVLEFGLVAVRAGQVVLRRQIILDWTRQPEVEQAWLEHRLRRAKQRMEKGAKKVCRIDLPYVKRGVPPGEGLQELLQILRQQRADNAYFVGHGILRFDGFRVQQSLEEWLGCRWRFGKHELVDTLALVRADLFPLPRKEGEQFFDYSQRILNAATHVKSSLDGVCLPRYRLDEDGTLAQGAHTAIVDAELTRRLLVRLIPAAGQVL